MGRPTFIIVGAERAGTTSLYENICKHSQIERAFKKEMEFFDRYYDMGVEEYEKLFVDIITGEATPTYYWNPVVPERIKRFNRKTKIIISLRDKGKMISSKYIQQVKKGVENLSFEDAIKYERIRIAGELERVSRLPYNYYPVNYVEYAYADRYDDSHTERWLNSGLKVLVISDWFDRQDETMREVFDFIGVNYEQHTWEHLNSNVQD